MAERVSSLLRLLLILVVLVSGCGELGRVDEILLPAQQAPQALHVQFATPHTVRWRWDAAALGDEVTGYELWYGTDAQAVEERRADAVRWDAASDPNLAYRESPFGANLVRRTTVLGLLPQTTYHARLWTWLAGGGSRMVAEGTATTGSEPLGRRIIFAETEHLAGDLYVFDRYPETTDLAHGGIAALWLNGGGGWLNGQLVGLTVDTSAIPTESWAQAYLEFFVSVSLTPVGYIETQLMAADGTRYLYTEPDYIALPDRPDAWTQVEIPLSHLLTRDDIALSAARPAAVEDFLIGADWGAGSRVRIDDVALRF